MATLHIVSPSSLARTIELTDNLISIGRTSENEISIQDHNVSRRHGVLVRDGDDYQIHDFKSANGTFVNGERIMAVKLQHGATIRLGAVELRYESAAAAIVKPAEDTPSLVGQKPQELLRSSGVRKQGMSKVVKPEYAGSKLQTGPVTLKPGFSAKPIPPAPSHNPES